MKIFVKQMLFVSVILASSFKTEEHSCKLPEKPQTSEVIALTPKQKPLFKVSLLPARSSNPIKDVLPPAYLMRDLLRGKKTDAFKRKSSKSTVASFIFLPSLKSTLDAARSGDFWELRELFNTRSLKLFAARQLFSLETLDSIEILVAITKAIDSKEQAIDFVIEAFEQLTKHHQGDFPSLFKAREKFIELCCEGPFKKSPVVLMDALFEHARCKRNSQLIELLMISPLAIHSVVAKWLDNLAKKTSKDDLALLKNALKYVVKYDVFVLAKDYNFDSYSRQAKSLLSKKIDNSKKDEYQSDHFFEK